MVWDCFLRLCLGCEFLAAALWGCSWHCCDAHPGSVVCESSTEEPQLCTGEAPPPQSYCCTPQSDSDSDHRWRVPEFPPSDYGCALKPAMKSQLHLMLRRGCHESSWESSKQEEFFPAQTMCINIPG